MRGRLLSRGMGLPGAVLSALLLALAGCEQDAQTPMEEHDPSAIPPDLESASLGPREPVGQREIRILSAAQVQLGFGKRTTIRVLLRDGDSKPVAGERVSFGLLGRSQDASLDALDALTDDEGKASTTLMAGEMAATFELRVAALGALDRHVGVAIGDSGFGTLIVQAPYAGVRHVRERVVVVQPETTCEELERSAGDPSYTLLGEQEQAEFLALPAAVTYAVGGFAQGPSGAVLAVACVDGLMVEADRSITTSLSWIDGRLVPADEVGLELELDARAAASWLSGVLSGATSAAVTLDATGAPLGDDAEARFLLDALDATLRDDMGDAALALADALVKSRADAAGALEQSLRSRLTIDDQGPLRGVDALAQRTARALQRIGLAAGVMIEGDGASYALRSATKQLETRADDGSVLARVTLPSTAVTGDGHARAVAGSDALDADRLGLRVALGALAVKVVRAIADAQDDADPEAPGKLLGCSTLAEWLSEQALDGASACDDACVAAVCERAMVRLLAAAEPSLLAVDTERPDVTLAGTLVLEDGDGDLIADVISAEALSGEWLPASEDGSGAALFGSATAVVVAE